MNTRTRKQWKRDQRIKVRMTLEMIAFTLICILAAFGAWYGLGRLCFIL